MRRVGRIVALLTIAFVTCDARAEAPVSFDLRCDTRSGVPIHFRFDSGPKKWCWGACQAVWPVDRITSRLIALSVRGADRAGDWNLQIDRYTGTFSAVHVGSGNGSDGGQCFPLPFSGFPEQRF